MASILKDVSSVAACRQMGFSGVALQQTIENLIAAQRSDDTSDNARLATREKLNNEIRMASQGRRNANDAASYLQVAHTVLSEVRNLLIRADDLSRRAQADTISDSERMTLNAEFQETVRTIADIGHNTKFNGVNVFGASLRVAVGGPDLLNVNVGSINSDASTTLGLTAGAAVLTSPAQARSASAAIKIAIQTVIDTRASLIASLRQLAEVSNALGIQIESMTAAYSQILGANGVNEVVNLIKWQILHLSGTGALNQANRMNQLQQQLLTLLQEQEPSDM